VLKNFDLCYSFEQASVAFVVLPRNRRCRATVGIAEIVGGVIAGLGY
jgi:hypothetical protein